MCARIRDAIDARPDVVIVVATDDGAAALQALADLRRAVSGPYVVAIVPSAVRAVEWRLRELGAAAVLGDDVGADAVADVCRWALRTLATTVESV